MITTSLVSLLLAFFFVDLAKTLFTRWRKERKLIHMTKGESKIAFYISDPEIQARSIRNYELEGWVRKP